MTKNTGNNCEGTQVFLTEISTTGSGRVTVLGTTKTGVALTSYFEIKHHLGFPDSDLRGLIADALNSGNLDLGISLLGDVLSEDESVAWGDIAECYQVHVVCDCSPEQRDVEYSDLPTGCPDCEMIGSWRATGGDYCEACGYETGKPLTSDIEGVI